MNATIARRFLMRLMAPGWILALVGERVSRRPSGHPIFVGAPCLLRLVELTELGPVWLDHLRANRAGGKDLVAHWSARSAADRG